MYTSINENLRKMYLEYVNDFLTVERFAEHHNLNVKDAHVIIELGRQYHETYVASLKNETAITTIYIVLRNADFTEGRGPMLFHKVFSDHDKAVNYIKSKCGIYGSPQYDKPNIYNSTKSSNGQIEVWNGYEIITASMDLLNPR